MFLDPLGDGQIAGELRDGGNAGGAAHHAAKVAQPFALHLRRKEVRVGIH
jgi:hypothetical protein